MAKLNDYPMGQKLHNRSALRPAIILCAALSLLPACSTTTEPEIRFEVRHLTEGPRHHFFGYIGHVQNTPWNGDGSLMVALRVGFQERMPTAEDVADIVLIDPATREVRKIEETRAWNPQQGTMLYWNPEAPETQFFFNDRDQQTGKVFAALYDIEERRRLREYRFEDTPVGNGGVSQAGGAFAAINYARMARLRPVTGYPEAWDWTVGEKHPEDDGVFRVDVDTGERRLLVSFAEMRDVLKERHPTIVDKPLFINHTLWNRDGDRLFFFVRGTFGNRDDRINVPMTIRGDGSGLTEQRVFIGGHPEWEFGARMIGEVGDDLVIYDTERQEVVETIGSRDVFPDAGGDTALSPDGKWIVNGWSGEGVTRYTIFRRRDGAWVHSDEFQRGPYTSGKLRIDSAPTWNRDSNQIAVPGLAEDGTRQMFVITIATE